MNLRNEHGLFGALERELRRAQQPLDCATLFDMPSIREHAQTVNRVSGYLGNMWRKGQVLRVAAPKLEGTRARWMYVLAKPTKVQIPDASQAIAYDERVERVFEQHRMEITEEGDTVVITLPAITITIKRTEQR
jgi:hypothetical protein